MSRRRTGTQYVPITISIPATMLNLIEMQLKPKESRSAWIAEAISKQLNGSDWNVAIDGTPSQMFHAFKHKMEEHNVKIDVMFYNMIQENIDRATASTDEC